MEYINIYELEKLKMDLIWSKENDLLMKKIFRILEGNFKIYGAELLKQIMDYKEIDISDVSILTAISTQTIEKILSNQQEITSGLAVNLSRLGYSKDCFLRKK